MSYQPAVQKIMLFLLVGLTGGCIEGGHDGDNNPTETESAAIEVLKMHMEARNSRDSEGLAATNNYPYVRLGESAFQIWETPEEYIIFEENTVIPLLDY